MSPSTCKRDCGVLDSLPLLVITTEWIMVRWDFGSYFAPESHHPFSRWDFGSNVVPKSHPDIEFCQGGGIRVCNCELWSVSNFVHELHHVCTLISGVGMSFSIMDLCFKPTDMQCSKLLPLLQWS